MFSIIITIQRLEEERLPTEAEQQSELLTRQTKRAATTHILIVNITNGILINTTNDFS